MQQIIEFTTNNALLVSGLLASALAVVFYELRAKQRDIASLSVSQAVRLINAGGKVLDVRSNEQYLNGHVLDAQNFPEAQLLENPESKLSGGSNVLLVCDNGSNSGGCAARLRKAGYENVFNLRGGIEEWRRDNLPLISGK